MQKREDFHEDERQYEIEDPYCDRISGNNFYSCHLDGGGVLLPHARNQIQLVLQHKDVLSPEVYYAVLMLEQRLESNAFLQAVSQGAGKMMESLSFQQKDVAMLFNGLVIMALDLKPFYREGQ